MELDTLVLYDIEDDRLRTRIAEDCKDGGLTRIQMSAFRGPMTRTRRAELAAKLKSRLGKRKGRLLIVALCEKDARGAIEVRNLEDPPGMRTGRPEESSAVPAGGAEAEGEPEIEAGAAIEAQTRVEAEKTDGTLGVDDQDAHGSPNSGETP